MRCVFCLQNQEIRDEQVLVRGDHLYLCAPKGQLVEGFLLVAPYQCIGCFSRAPTEFFPELAWMRGRILEFYRREYGTTRAILYEQGRAGAGAVVDESGGFPFHAHLCCLPSAIDLHGVLARMFARKSVSGPHELPSATAGEPYVYVDDTVDRAVYLPLSPETRRALEQMRLRVIVSELLAIPQRGYWRTCPDDRQLEQLIPRWKRTWRT